MRDLIILSLLLFAARAVFAEDTAPDTEAADAAAASQDAAMEDPAAPKTMSGMSILGNEEAPKSLVIIPWKSSEIGDDISLADTLDDRAQPVDKEVFLRELNFYAIRSGEEQETP